MTKYYFYYEKNFAGNPCPVKSSYHPTSRKLTTRQAVGPVHEITEEEFASSSFLALQKKYGGPDDERQV